MPPAAFFIMSASFKMISFARIYEMPPEIMGDRTQYLCVNRINYILAFLESKMFACNILFCS